MVFETLQDIVVSSALNTLPVVQRDPSQVPLFDPDGGPRPDVWFTPGKPRLSNGDTALVSDGTALEAVTINGIDATTGALALSGIAWPGWTRTTRLHVAPRWRRRPSCGMWHLK